MLNKSNIIIAIKLTQLRTLQIAIYAYSKEAAEVNNSVLTNVMILVMPLGK